MPQRGHAKVSEPSFRQTTSLSPAAARLAELDEQMERSLKLVRNHLVEAHDTKKKAKAYYDDFGLQPDGQLRSARPSRVED